MPLNVLLWGALAWSVLGLASVGVLVVRLRSRIGREAHFDRPFTWSQRLFTVGAAVATAAVVVNWAELMGVLALAIIALAWATMLISPGANDAALGELGVRRGWYARTFEELEEWRLTGDHLRWKLRGEWQASPAPRATHAVLRDKLVALCPERESSFKA